MKRMHTAAIVLGLLVLGAFLVRADTAKPDASAPDTAELAKAVSLTAAKLQSTVKSPADYKLTKVEMQWIVGKDEYVWRATYRPIPLIPRGKGGEVFINVNLTTERTTVRYGE